MAIQSRQDFNNFSDFLSKLSSGDSERLSDKVETYLDHLVLNLVLTSLTRQQRIELYNSLNKNDLESARNLINKSIPDFQNKLNAKVNAENLLLGR